jgi:hypothetical protein
MLDSVPSVESCSSSSSRDSSSSDSNIVSPSPIPDIFISVELYSILEMPEAETAHRAAEPVDTRPHPDTSTGMFSNIL